MATKKQIIDEIERLIDHYEPYRSILDSEENMKVRAALSALLSFAKRGLDEK